MKEWSTNLTVRTQISAFLAGTFFAVLLVFATQKDKQTLFHEANIHAVSTMVSLTITFIAFAFSTFAFGLSADCFRVSVDKNITSLEQKARTAFHVGLSFFKVGYVFMMCSLAFVLAYAHWLIGLFGFLVFVGFWTYLWKRTGPYKKEKKTT